MFLIFGTDAPLYHYPIVTIAMVVVNVVIHWLIVVTGFDATPYYLHFGDGLHPLQWVTHNFLHGGPLQGWPHLLFNMIFLWPFGMIVEGKIGWARMLVLYMAIASCQGFTQQLVMLPSDPKDHAADLVALLDHPDNPMSDQEKYELREQFRRDLLRSGNCSLGSSAVIFGLLAVCAIWAPQNEFESYFRWSALIRAPDGGVRDWTVATVCGMFVAKEFGMFIIQNGALSSAALHLNGFVVGGALGLAMLYMGHVDCEGFDLISKLTGEPFKAPRTLRLEREERRKLIEAAKPKGPPQAVVPRMARVLKTEISEPLATPPDPKTVASVAPLQRQALPLADGNSATANDLTLPAFDDLTLPAFDDLALPAFDNATTSMDRVTESKSRIEAFIARGDFIVAVKRLASERKRHRGFVVSAVSMGKLAEGLIRGRHFESALKVLTLGADAYPAFAPRWRIRAAMIQLTANEDPIAAIKLLKSVDREMLDRDTREHYLRVAKRAKRMAEGSQDMP